MNTPITFNKKSGWLASGRFPQECIDDCGASGQADEAVEYWRKELKFVEALEPVESLARDYLREYGAWDDLDEADLETIANRILWMACGEMHEQGEWFGLVH